MKAAYNRQPISIPPSLGGLVVSRDRSSLCSFHLGFHLTHLSTPDFLSYICFPKYLRAERLYLRVYLLASSCEGDCDLRRFFLTSSP